MDNIILGDGNLARSLLEEIEKRDGQRLLYQFTRDNGFNYPYTIPSINIKDPQNTIVWNTIGAGSVPEAKENFEKVLNVHVALVSLLTRILPKDVMMINFSTNYVVDPEHLQDNTRSAPLPDSLYALSKKMMEDFVILQDRSNVHCIRVANLYGIHKPTKTFPGKILENSYRITSLPPNMLTPTPTEWLARKCLDHAGDIRDSEYPIHHLAPVGEISAVEFGKKILDKELEIGARDSNRPMHSAIGNSFGIPDDIHKCWEESDFRKKFIDR